MKLKIRKIGLIGNNLPLVNKTIFSSRETYENMILFDFSYIPYCSLILDSVIDRTGPFYKLLVIGVNLIKNRVWNNFGAYHFGVY